MIGTESPDHHFNIVIQQGTNNQSLIWKLYSCILSL